MSCFFFSLPAAWRERGGPSAPDGCGRRHLGGAPAGPRTSPGGEAASRPRGCPHPTPGHAAPGLGPQTAGGISGEGKGGRGWDGQYSVATVRREAESTKCIPRFIGGLYRTFYYNLGDDSFFFFLYGACYTAGPLQPVNVQRGPGLAVGRGARPRSPRGAAGLRLGSEEVGGKTLKKKKVRRKERVEGDHAPPPHTYLSDQAWVSPMRSVRGRGGVTAGGASLSSAGAATEHSPHSTRVCVYVYVRIIYMYV